MQDGGVVVVDGVEYVFALIERQTRTGDHVPGGPMYSVARGGERVGHVHLIKTTTGWDLFCDPRDDFDRGLLGRIGAEARRLGIVRE